MAKKTGCLAIALIMLFSLAACGDMLGFQRQLNELKQKVELQDDKIKDLETENALFSDRITNLEDKNIVLTDRVSDLEKMLGNFITPAFLFTISVEDQTIVQGESFTLTATIINLTGISFYYYSGYEYPVSWHISNWNLGQQLPVEQPEPKYWYFEKDETKEVYIVINTVWYDYDDATDKQIKNFQNPGAYEISAKANFGINVDSNVVNIMVIEELMVD